MTHYINTVFEERGIKSSITPNGNNIYSVSISILDKKIDLGIYDTEELAQQGLIDGKIKYIKELAESCKGKVQDYVYEAMLRYEI